MQCHSEPVEELLNLFKIFLYQIYREDVCQEHIWCKHHQQRRWVENQCPTTPQKNLIREAPKFFKGNFLAEEKMFLKTLI